MDNVERRGGAWWAAVWLGVSGGLGGWLLLLFRICVYAIKFDANADNGKKISCLYCCNIDPDVNNRFTKVKVFNRITDKSLEEKEKLEFFEEIEMEWDGLLMLKSRKVAFEIEENVGKRFYIYQLVFGIS